MSSSSITKVLPEHYLRLLKHSQKALKELTKVDPHDRYVALFPDHRNIFQGMGINLLGEPRIEEIYDRASEISKINIMKLCMKDPLEELKKNLENGYLAAFVTSHAAMEKIAIERPEAINLIKGAGGIGIGYLNSLVFTKSISFQDGVELAQHLGRSMDEASKIVPSGRLIIRFKPATSKIKVCEAARQHCLKVGIPEEIAVCSVAGQIRPHLLVIAGHDEAIRYLEDEGYRLFDFREMRRDPRQVNAHHTDLMQPASLFVKTFIEKKLIEDPNYIRMPRSCGLYSTTRGARLHNVKAIIKDLCEYPIRGIRLEQMLHAMYKRPDDHHQPNTIILWDKYLLKTLSKVNRLASIRAKVYNV